MSYKINCTFAALVLFLEQINIDKLLFMYEITYEVFIFFRLYAPIATENDNLVAETVKHSFVDVFH